MLPELFLSLHFVFPELIMKHCRLVKYQLPLPDYTCTKELSDTRVLHISYFTDLHSCCSDREKSEFMRILKHSAPDIVLCGGDSIVAIPGKSVLPAVRFLESIASEYPLYIGTGNHEYRARLYPETYGTMYEEYRKALDDVNCQLLENTDCRISLKGIPVRICGFDMPAHYYSRFHNHAVPVRELQQVFGDCDDTFFTILLAHHPKMMHPAFTWGADLTLCGHYHGGIMRFGDHRGLISPDLRPFPGNAYGHFQSGKKHAIISSGCGEHSIPVRIGNPREIVSLNITV